VKKVKESEYLATRLTPAFWKKIQQLAEAEKRPLSAMTRILLEEAVRARKESQDGE
jgi:hypothetical protein